MYVYILLLYYTIIIYVSIYHMVSIIFPSMCALRLTNIPMFATLRRLTQLFVIISEYMLLNKKPAPLVGLSIFIMISGSLIGGWGSIYILYIERYNPIMKSINNNSILMNILFYYNEYILVNIC